MSTGNIPPESVSRARRAQKTGSEARENEDEGRREKLADSKERDRENEAKETLGIASHVATVATFSRARERACVCIYSGWRIVGGGEGEGRGGEGGGEEKEPGEGERRRKTRGWDRVTCARVRGEDY